MSDELSFRELGDLVAELDETQMSASVSGLVSRFVQAGLRSLAGFLGGLQKMDKDSPELGWVSVLSAMVTMLEAAERSSDAERCQLAADLHDLTRGFRA